MGGAVAGPCTPLSSVTPTGLNSLALLACPAHAHALVARESLQAKEARGLGHTGGARTASATQTGPFTCELIHEQLRSVSSWCVQTLPCTNPFICLSINTFTCQLIQEVPITCRLGRISFCTKPGNQEVAPSTANTGDSPSQWLRRVLRGPGSGCSHAHSFTQSFRERGLLGLTLFLRGKREAAREGFDVARSTNCRNKGNFFFSCGRKSGDFHKAVSSSYGGTF